MGRAVLPRISARGLGRSSGADQYSVGRSYDEIDVRVAHVTIRWPVRIDETAAKFETSPIAHRPLKHTLLELLDEGRFDEIAEMATRRKRVLGSLVSLTYAADVRTSWRAVEALGVAASRIAEADPDHVRELLRRLMWLVNDESGGICLRAPEAMAEILRRHARDSFQDVAPAVVSALIDSDPQVRGMAVWCLHEVGRVDLLGGRPDLTADEDPVDLYEDGMITRTTVSQLVQCALSATPAE